MGKELGNWASPGAAAWRVQGGDWVMPSRGTADPRPSVQAGLPERRRPPAAPVPQWPRHHPASLRRHLQGRRTVTPVTSTLPYLPLRPRGGPALCPDPGTSPPSKGTCRVPACWSGCSQPPGSPQSWKGAWRRPGKTSSSPGPTTLTGFITRTQPGPLPGRAASSPRWQTGEGGAQVREERVPSVRLIWSGQGRRD